MSHFFHVARILIVMLGDVIVVKCPSLLKKFARMANAIFSFFLLDEKIFPSLNKTMTTAHWHPDPISTFMRKYEFKPLKMIMNTIRHRSGTIRPDVVEKMHHTFAKLFRLCEQNLKI